MLPLPANTRLLKQVLQLTINSTKEVNIEM